MESESEIKLTPRLYEITAQRIERWIKDGRFEGCKRLPGEPKLAAMLGVSRATVKSALALVRKLGLIETVPGFGNRVRVPPDAPTPSAPSEET